MHLGPDGRVGGVHLAPVDEGFSAAGVCAVRVLGDLVRGHDGYRVAQDLQRLGQRRRIRRRMIRLSQLLVLEQPPSLVLAPEDLKGLRDFK